MDDRKKKIIKVFEEAIGLVDRSEQEALLAKACDDPKMLDEVCSLLRAAKQPDALFDTPAPKSPSDNENPISERPGSVIGPYRLVERIGEGGFGVVYLAQQTEPVERRVALKIIKVGMDTSEVVARFEAERQALARMEHPNIATVFDAGATGTGRPYFVMEFVEGQPITELIEHHGLDLNTKIELFQQVCEAIGHAHQKGIIHRDIKPSNVIVGTVGDKLVAKVIDFGIAKAIEGKLTDKTTLTHIKQIIGTPIYMSPEQTEMGGGDVDTRSDIYSLGVLLYQLITGHPPFGNEDLLRAGGEEIYRIIREVDPPTPSRKLIQLKETAQSENETETSLQLERTGKKCLGDLDAIVMKALDKDRARRYETASEFCEDLSNFLQGFPVKAVPASLAYKVKKYARRNTLGLVITAAFLLLLISSTVISAWLAIERNAALQKEEKVSEDLQRKTVELQSAITLREEQEQLTKQILSREDVRASAEAFETGEKEEQLARLARAVRLDPGGVVPRSLLTSTLSHMPISRPSIILKHDNDVQWASWSPNGGFIVTLEKEERYLNVWSSDGGVLLNKVQLPGGGRVRGVLFSPDDQWMLVWVLDDKPEYVLQNLTDFSQKEMLNHSGVEIEDSKRGWVDWKQAVFDPSGRTLATQVGGNIRLWDLTDLNRSVSFQFDSAVTVGDLDFNQQGDHLAVTWTLLDQRVYSVNSQLELSEVARSRSRSRYSRFCDNDLSMVSFAYEGSRLVRFTEGPHSTRVWEVEGETGNQFDLDIGGKRLVVGGSGTMRALDLTSGESFFEQKEFTSLINHLEFSADGSYILVSFDDRNLKLVDSKHGDVIYSDVSGYVSIGARGRRIGRLLNRDRLLVVKDVFVTAKDIGADDISAEQVSVGEGLVDAFVFPASVVGISEKGSILQFDYSLGAPRVTRRGNLRLGDDYDYVKGNASVADHGNSVLLEKEKYSFCIFDCSSGSPVEKRFPLPAKPESSFQFSRESDFVAFRISETEIAVVGQGPTQLSQLTFELEVEGFFLSRSARYLAVLMDGGILRIFKKDKNSFILEDERFGCVKLLANPGEDRGCLVVLEDGAQWMDFGDQGVRFGPAFAGGDISYAMDFNYDQGLFTCVTSNGRLAVGEMWSGKAFDVGLANRTSQSKSRLWMGVDLGLVNVVNETDVRVQRYRSGEVICRLNSRDLGFDDQFVICGAKLLVDSETLEVFTELKNKSGRGEVFKVLVDWRGNILETRKFGKPPEGLLPAEVRFPLSGSTLALLPGAPRKYSFVDNLSGEVFVSEFDLGGQWDGQYPTMDWGVFGVVVRENSIESFKIGDSKLLPGGFSLEGSACSVRVAAEAGLGIVLPRFFGFGSQQKPRVVRFDSERLVDISSTWDGVWSEEGPWKGVGHGLSPSDVQFTDDGSSILIISGPFSEVYDSRTGVVLSERLTGRAMGRLGPQSSKSRVGLYGIDSKGRYAFVCSRNKINVWKAQELDGELISLLHDSYVVQGVIASEKNFLFGASVEGELWFWDTEIGELRMPPIDAGGAVIRMKLSSRESALLTIGPPNCLRLWDTETGLPLAVPVKTQNPIIAANYSEGAEAIVAADEGGVFYKWGLKNVSESTALQLADLAEKIGGKSYGETGILQDLGKESRFTLSDYDLLVEALK